jgi:hypothetical protein
MITVRVDFNARARDGLVRASQRRADDVVSLGERVLAVDSAEDMSYEANVESIDEETGRIYLRIDWEPAAPMSDLDSLGGYVATGIQLSNKVAVSADSMVKSWRPGKDLSADLAVAGQASANR